MGTVSLLLLPESPQPVTLALPKELGAGFSTAYHHNQLCLLAMSVTRLSFPSCNVKIIELGFESRTFLEGRITRSHKVQGAEEQ